MLNHENEIPAVGSTGLGCAGNTPCGNGFISNAAPRKHTKRWKVLQAFFDRADLGLNMFDAIQLCRDYVLRTTVSELSSQYGIVFRSEYETIGNEFGTQVKRYYLADSERAKVTAMLGMVGAA